MKSFIPWIGGKSQLRSRILELFPAEQPGVYVEVFGGAGWVLFAKDRHAPLEVFNDFDGNLINLYRCIQHHCGELQRELRWGGAQRPVISREVFSTYKAQLEVPGLTDIQRAARYYYIIRASFGADRDTFGCSRKPMDSTVDHLALVQERLKDVVIDNRHYADVIRTYNKTKTLFYLDPPYFRTEGYYQGFARDDHAELRRTLQAVKGRFVLSYNDAPEIRDLYRGYNIHEVQRANTLAHASGKRDTYNELVITNY